MSTRLWLIGLVQSSDPSLSKTPCYYRRGLPGRAGARRPSSGLRGARERTICCMGTYWAPYGGCMPPPPRYCGCIPCGYCTLRTGPETGPPARCHSSSGAWDTGRQTGDAGSHSEGDKAGALGSRIGKAHGRDWGSGWKGWVQAYGRGVTETGSGSQGRVMVPASRHPQMQRRG